MMESLLISGVLNSSVIALKFRYCLNLDVNGFYSILFLDVETFYCYFIFNFLVFGLNSLTM